MNLSRPFILRPVMTGVLAAALIIFGSIAYLRLPVSELPAIDFPTIAVSAVLPGANAETVAATVATPLERRLASIPGVIEMSSTSATGRTNIALQFDLGRNIDAAAQDVQTAISQASRLLPPSMPSPPTYSKVNPSDYGILYLALTSDTVPLTELDEFAETQVAERISQIPGVAQVLVFGSYKYAARIYLNPYALAARGLTLTAVKEAVQRNNTSLPTGVLYGGARTYALQSKGQLLSAKAYEEMVVAVDNGMPVHLRDIGYAVDGIQQDRQLTTYSDPRIDGRLQPAVMLSVKRQANANTVQVAEAIQAMLPEITQSAPADASLHLLYSRADFVHGCLREVQKTLLVAVALVVAVIFVFLRDARTTLISALVLPASIIGTFLVMKLLGFSLDSLSLMALTLATGFVVDDAIVVLENIVRHRELGKGVLAAALDGSREIAFTVVSMTLSLAAVFIPILLMPGIIGRLFGEFAVTVGVAILISGLVSLTLIPMLSSRFAQRPMTSPQGRLDSVLALYRRSLTWAVTHWSAMLGLSALLLLVMGVLFAAVPKGFMPIEDTGQVIGTTLAPEGTSFDRLNALQQQVARTAGENPAIATVMSNAGQGWGSTGGNNIGLLYMGLRPMDRRPNAESVRRELRRALAGDAGLQVFIEDSSPVNVGTLETTAQYQYVLQSRDIDALYQAAPAFEQALGGLPGLEDVGSDLALNNPQINIDVHRETAAALGVTADKVQETLASAFGGEQVGTIYGPANEYWVMMQLAPEFQGNPSALDALYVPGSGRSLVPLRAVADVKTGVGPLNVSHYGQLPSVTLSFDLAPGVNLREATARVNALAERLLGAEVTGRFAGSARSFQDSMRSLPLLLAVTILVIYVVLAILYENLLHPITILTALPLAMLGGLLSLLVFGSELNVFSFVGLILLVGLVKKNGIMMVDFALQLRKDRKLSPQAAIIEACMIRARPIMMTTVAAVLGTLPIALAVGAGAEMRRPLGIAIVGGLLVSQLLTLYLTPAFYLAAEHFVRCARKIAPARAGVGPIA